MCGFSAAKRCEAGNGRALRRSHHRRASSYRGGLVRVDSQHLPIHELPLMETFLRIINDFGKLCEIECILRR
jgi:hypothetical protein